ncbi:MAG: Bro-N domain-containing protein [Kiritimatiellae bacterium]|jgi:prophage antirepressor-like protein|nr:Bro-N domain-containing protein [Kiritimatiellia bacterium]
MRNTLQNMAQGDLFGNNIRVSIDENGEPWFVAKDVCGVLGLANPTRALKSLDNEDLTLLKVRADVQMREVNAVNESGLYHLIFKSRKPEAKAFKRWITTEVLPAIRKRGLYSGDAAALKGTKMRGADYMALRGIEGNTSGFGHSVAAICRKAGLEFDAVRKRGNRWPVEALDRAVGNRKAERGPLAESGEEVFFYEAK